MWVLASVGVHWRSGGSAGPAARVCARTRVCVGVFECPHQSSGGCRGLQCGFLVGVWEDISLTWACADFQQMAWSYGRGEDIWLALIPL